MKKINRFIIPFALVLGVTGCDKGFVEKNQNPYSSPTMEPQLLLAGAQRSMNVGSFNHEQTIVQQFFNPFNNGATGGFNYNLNVDGFNTARWDLYGRAANPVIKTLVQLLDLTKGDERQKNLIAITRIWKAFAFMTITDTYGDVPYFDAGKAYIENIRFPKYDDDKVIYDDLYKELKEAAASLSKDNEYVKGDLFWGGGTSSDASKLAQVTQWKKVAYSLMLRLGMRYSSLDPAKAASIVQEAFTGGVMQSPDDNVVVKLYSSAVNNPFSNEVRAINTDTYYLGEPFVTQLKNTKDPRLKYVAAKYQDPASISSNRDTTSANQYGYPIGVKSGDLTKPPYRGPGASGKGFDYSQINYGVVFSAVAPAFLITNAQTQLLLAEAKLRGFLPTAPGTVSQYYEAGVKSAMDDFKLYPGVQNPAIDANTQASFLRQPSVALTGVAATDLARINTQYWIACFTIGSEGWANFRRTDLPTLTPNPINGVLPGGGFVRRMDYPLNERNLNTANYNAAVSAMGLSTTDNTARLTTRVFWDVATKKQP